MKFYDLPAAEDKENLDISFKATINSAPLPPFIVLEGSSFTFAPDDAS